MTWILVVNHMDASLHELITIVDDRIILNISKGNWSLASENLNVFIEKWKKNKKLYGLFIDEGAVIQVDYACARAEMYLETQTEALSKGEMAFLKEHLRILHENELVNLENIF